MASTDYVIPTEAENDSENNMSIEYAFTNINNTPNRDNTEQQPMKSIIQYRKITFLNEAMPITIHQTAFSTVNL